MSRPGTVIYRCKRMNPIRALQLNTGESQLIGGNEVFDDIVPYIGHGGGRCVKKRHQLLESYGGGLPKGPSQLFSVDDVFKVLAQAQCLDFVLLSRQEAIGQHTEFEFTA